jgi:two-component system, NtrC family, response regulator AtoC
VKGRVLVVDDDTSMCEMLDAALTKSGFEVTCRLTATEAIDLIASRDFDVVVTDLLMRGLTGLHLCERISATRSDIPVVVITAFGSMDAAISAIRAGAYDFVPKPFDFTAFELTLNRAVQHHRLRDEVKRLKRAVSEAQGAGEMLGTSASIRKVLDTVDRISDSDASVLITGESGTGKELVARALHRLGPRRDGPFVAINCAALPEPLLESELFGHVRGAFTDARGGRAGLFVKAGGGILFLDEIGEMPVGLQPKVLRALQERTVRPVGSDTEVPFDARIVSATNRDLETAVEEGRLREDLYYRINVVHVDVPPLRARGNDVLLLAQHFLNRYVAASNKTIRGLSAVSAQRLLAYSWPGNVRELQNTIESAVALARFDEITVDDLPERIQSHRASHVLVAGDDPAELVPIEEVERRYILRVLEVTGANKTLAAKILGLDRTTLYRKLERYGVAGSNKVEPE